MMDSRFLNDKETFFLLGLMLKPEYVTVLFLRLKSHPITKNICKHVDFIEFQRSVCIVLNVISSIDETEHTESPVLLASLVGSVTNAMMRSFITKRDTQYDFLNKLRHAHRFNAITQKEIKVFIDCFRAWTEEHTACCKSDMIRRVCQVLDNAYFFYVDTYWNNLDVSRLMKLKKIFLRGRMSMSKIMCCEKDRDTTFRRGKTR